MKYKNTIFSRVFLVQSKMSIFSVLVGVGTGFEKLLDLFYLLRQNPK